MTNRDVISELHRVTHQIPAGKAMSYGDVGDHMVPRQTGRAVGRLLARFGEGAAWWRVVRRDGYISSYQRGPDIGSLQRDRLRQEGILIDDDTVPTEYLIHDLP
jgi:alkylated DNA nucleotide flippase Atl1